MNLLPESQNSTRLGKINFRIPVQYPCGNNFTKWSSNQSINPNAVSVRFDSYMEKYKYSLNDNFIIYLYFEWIRCFTLQGVYVWVS